MAEVLITLSILGVVAALTIPSLVNRQSDLAAQVKLKKAIANYENVAAVYMVENEASDLSTLGCDNLGDYFKVVESDDNCAFITADGVVWTFNAAGNAVVVDSVNSPRYGVVMWTAGGAVNAVEGTNNSGEAVVPKSSDIPTTLGAFGPMGTDNKNTAVKDPLKGYFSAAEFLNSKASELSSTAKPVTTPNGALVGVTWATDGTTPTPTPTP